MPVLNTSTTWRCLKYAVNLSAGPFSSISFISSEDKYSSHDSARLKLDSRKRTRDERDDRDMNKGSTWARKIIRTDDRPHDVRRCHRISSPNYNERNYEAPTLNEYEEAYDNQPKMHLEEKATIYEPSKVYESKPVAYVENKHKIIDNQPTFFKHKPKVPRIHENKPKVEEHKIEETLAEERPLSDAKRKRSRRLTELSPLMTSMVEDELKNIMIKIWQTLPDDAPKGAEKFVLDKLKNEAGDDLRNTIGLNVTKRLLNVNNNPSQKGLLIKLQLQSSISSHDLYGFCKKYHISNLKYVQQRTYAGRMLSWADLDELYSVNNLRCGNSKVTITPIYNFLKCPSMLKTVFDGTQDYATKEIEKEAAKKINKPDGKTIITADKVLAEDAKKVETKKEIISKDKSSDKKADVKTESKKTKAKESPKNVASKAEDKKSSQKTNVQKETLNQNSTNTETNVVNAKPTGAAASKPVQPLKTPNVPAPTTSTKKETVTPKTVETKPNSVKMEPKTPVTEAAKPAVKLIQSKDSVKKEVRKDEENKQASKTVAKATTSSTTAVKEPAKTVAKEPAKTVAKKPVKTVAKEPAKTVAKEPATNVAIEPAKTVAKEPATNVAKEPAKLVSKEPVKTITKESTKPILKDTKPIASKRTAPAKKETVTPEPSKKTVSKTSPVVPKTVVKTPTKPTKVDAKAKNNADDFDELDDHDILALLSGGIVLDECSGSDED